MILDKYKDATREDLLRVVKCAEDLERCMAEFPDDPSIWGEDIVALDSALELCPGTALYYNTHSTEELFSSEKEHPDEHR